ncbi:MAG TPA: response regulator transcription factor [Mycobacteriales bacterium]|nr:response regulator transcription factor [Mycobacteriales bacterium]
MATTRVPIQLCEPAAEPISVFIVDHHEVSRRGLRRILEGAEGLRVVGEAESTADARRNAALSRAQVVILEPQNPDGAGMKLCDDLRSVDGGGPAVLVLTASISDSTVMDAIHAGVRGYLVKDATSAEILLAVRALASGGSTLSGPATMRMMSRLREHGETHSRLQLLSVRERAVLDLLADGLSNREIATRLAVAEKTAKNNVSNVFAKLGVRTRTKAAMIGLEARRSTIAGI